MLVSERVSSTLALLLGLLACVSLTLAVVTDYWLYTSEPVTGSFTFNNTAYPVRMLVRLHSGLWRMCTYDSQLLSLSEELQMVLDKPPAIPDTPPDLSPAPGMITGRQELTSGQEQIMTSHDLHLLSHPADVASDEQLPLVGPLEAPPTEMEEEPVMNKNCTPIAYEGQVSGRVDGADTTLSIARAIRRSTPIIVASLILLPFAITMATVGNAKANLMAVFAALVYTASALCLACGVIVYVSVLNDEVSYRKRPLPGVKDDFTYTYGWAFFCAAVAFMSNMCASVLNATMFVRRRHHATKFTGDEVKAVQSHATAGDSLSMTLDLPRSSRMAKRNVDDCQLTSANITYNIMHALS